MPTEPLSVNIMKGWMPDYLPFFMPDGALITAENLVPYDEFYYPALQPLAYSSNAITGTPVGAVEYLSNNGNYYVFIGTLTKLYRLEVALSLTDITRAAGAYTATANKWSFTRYREWVVATNYIDDPQILKGMTTANFVALGGSPPKAKYCVLYKGHLILAYINDGTVRPQRLLWSAWENIEDFVQSQTTGADKRDLDDADGEITGMTVLGSLLVITHKNSITIGWYSKAPYTFSFDSNKVKDKGAIEGTLVSCGNACYFFDERDIYQMTADGTIAPIGEGIKRTLLNDLDIGNFHRISAGSDMRRGLVYWSYPSILSNGTPDTIIVLNPKVMRFTKIKVTHHGIFGMHKNVMDADSMDSIYPDADAVIWDADSSFWLDNSAIVGCINSDLKVAYFGGNAMSWTLETAQFNYKNKIHMVQRVRPKVDRAAANVTVQIGSRFNEADAVTYSSASTVGSNGYANTRKTGRYSLVKVTGGLCDGISGIDVEAVVTGNR